MAKIEVSRTLVKSPPELWTELEGAALTDAIEDLAIRSKEPERALAWEAKGARGTAVLEPSGWGTKVTLTAEVEEIEQVVASAGFWSRWRQPPPPPPPRSGPSPTEVRRRFEQVLDDLGSAHRIQPFSRG